MRQLARMSLPAALLMALSLPATAAPPRPEIERAPGSPQAIGAAHSLRTIPEACVRLEGTFTGEADASYDFRATRTSANCQPRAHLVDAAKVKPSLEKGWKLNDVIRVPLAGCEARQAVVTVWRKPADVSTPGLDGQGRARIYLDESMEKIASGDLAPVPLYAAAMTLEGDRCD